jgi:hypothetical protein
VGFRLQFRIAPSQPLQSSVNARDRAHYDATTPQDAPDVLGRLGARLIEAGTIDQRTLDRARRVAGETGDRFDRVLTQLGLVPLHRDYDSLAVSG